VLFFAFPVCAQVALWFPKASGLHLSTEESTGESHREMTVAVNGHERGLNQQSAISNQQSAIPNQQLLGDEERQPIDD
jgi:hypothetical protein